jgi:hypothetical protein
MNKKGGNPFSVFAMFHAVRLGVKEGFGLLQTEKLKTSEPAELQWTNFSICRLLESIQKISSFDFYS